MNEFSSNLLKWYEHHKRDFPWRTQNVNVYHTWVCEVMSQQTTLGVVLPRFARFILDLPDVHALARCPDELLQKLWLGLGYYARARNLRKGACYLIERYQGAFPQTRKEWLEVPGCGPYTAAVIASICFREPVAAVDGNVIRVVSRLCGLQSGVWENRLVQEKILCYVSEKIKNPHIEHPGDFNQAMMELGATVCKKQNPLCFQCPVQKYCLAFEKNIVSLCPPVKPRKTFQKERILVLLCRKKSQYLLITRNQGFLSQTKGFPVLRVCEKHTLEFIFSVLQKQNFHFQYLKGHFQHTITHHKMTASVLLVSCELQHDAKMRELFEFFSLSQKIQWHEFHQLKQNISSSLDLKALGHLSSSCAMSFEKE
jgi:A/G-specific adenine glycosylase